MSESKLTPEELHNIELEIPAFRRTHRIQARINLSRRLKNPNAGGIRSPLDPINPHKLTEYGEPTVPLKAEDIAKPGKN